MYLNNNNKKNNNNNNIYIYIKIKYNNSNDAHIFKQFCIKEYPRIIFYVYVTIIYTTNTPK